MQIPLVLTSLRILLSPVFLLLYAYPEKWHITPYYLPWILLMIVGVCELSDVFDGFFARRHNSVTRFGKILDPMADSLFRLTVFLAFTKFPVQLPLVIVLLFFIRDSVIAMLRTLCALQGITLAARLSGKIKAIVQAAVVFFILILMILYTTNKLELPVFQKMSWYAASIAVIYTLASGIEYFWANRHYLKRAFEVV